MRCKRSSGRIDSGRDVISERAIGAFSCVSVCLIFSFYLTKKSYSHSQGPGAGVRVLSVVWGAVRAGRCGVRIRRAGPHSTPTARPRIAQATSADASACATGTATFTTGTWASGGAACPSPSAGGAEPAAPGAGGACARGAEGIQTREVRCVRTADGTAAEEDAICEYFEPKARLEQACLVPCPRDCVLSEFSPWSPCPAPCGGGAGLQSRTRSVLAPPLFGGGACPALAEFRACESPGECRDGEGGGFGLRVGPWSECEAPPTAPRLARQVRQTRRRKNRERSRERERARSRDPETRELIKKKRTRNRQNRPNAKLWDLQVGHQTRQLTCSYRNATPAQLSLCSQGPLPMAFRSCVVTRDCEVSEWGDWSTCSKTCYDPNGPQGERSRLRHALRFPVGGAAECPALEEVEPCNPQGDGVLPCPVYSWRTSEWTECRVDTLLSQQDRRRGNQTGLCGGGVQSREVYCIQGDPASHLSSARDKEGSRPVDSRLCLGPVPNTTQLCHIECPVQCAVSPWNAWGPCTLENCQEHAGKKGFKLRKRVIINEPTGGAGNCPHLVEAIPCDEPSCYDWLVVMLEECIPDNGKPCGPGTQVLQVQCINSDGARVERQLCRDAILPIPGGTTEGRQTRSRAILAYGAGDGGAQCPNSSSLQEWRGCNGHPCTVYHWQTSPWGQCIEDSSLSSVNSSSGSTHGHGGGVACSIGMQTRKVICVRDNVGQVPPKKCPETLRPETVRPCLLPCKRDCVVTPYSDWTPCPSTCQTGSNTKKKQNRKRIIIQLPANGGQDCPEVLSQDRECEAPSVCQGYRWKTHKWRRCQLLPWAIRQGSPGAQESCGPGLQTRAVSCRKQDGGQADIRECLKFPPVPPVTQPCQLPCQADCQLSAWSKFSSCSSDCVGVRTRKRALVGRSKKEEQCRNTQVYALSETRYCPCDKYRAQPVGDWSDCVLPEAGRVEGILGMKVQGDVKECGQGYRYQAMACYNQDQRLVETAYCSSHVLLNGTGAVSGFDLVPSRSHS
ncbi:hypothetical protein SKAU_G00297630 [Synaphobranchus kaupii]|uniref:Spondin-like TSP1 domain-containing protein n=1 Tax=Synaphobranchus kaupii TaxID=118154 RepID=A0A9Q1EV17_SYNKA|nr:hypothetical protein SKAU_G00297630 [Synaphobranchus kaupii]